MNAIKSPALVFTLFLSFLFSSPAYSWPARTVDVTDYDLTLNIPLDKTGYDVFENTLNGKATITLVNTGDEAMTVVPVLLYRLMKADAVTDEAGNAIPFSQDLTALEGFELMQVNYVDIRPEGGLLSGESITFTITYSGTLAGYTETGMLYVQEKLDPKFTIIRYETFAYPQVLFPDSGQRREALSDKHNQTISVTVPEGHVVVNSAPLQSRETADGMTTFVFKTDEPDDIIMLPIAPYGLIEAGGNEIYYLPEDQAGAEQLVTEMDRAMALFTEWFGPLHEEGGLRVVEIPEMYGSQTDYPVILQTADAFRDQSQLAQLYHELSHLWNARDTELNPARWNEGLATFLQGLATAKLAEKDSLGEWQERLFGSFKRRLNGNENYRVPLEDYGTEGLTSLMYVGGGVFFSLLYDILGEEAFLETYGNFYQTHYQTGSTTRDLLEHLYALGNPEVDRLVKDWFETEDYAGLVMSAETFTDLLGHYHP